MTTTKPSETRDRLVTLRGIALFATAVLLGKVLVTILLEYRQYFPPNFDSAFLSGRRYSFHGLYRVAFYTHLLSGPLAVVGGTLLAYSGPRMLGSTRRGLATFHKRLGRTLVAIVIVVVVPSGLVMASQAFAGPIAGAGFMSLSIATAISAATAIYYARAGDIASHRRWAVRCFILLCSPLLLRLAVGAAIVLDFESESFYQANAWLSWLIPLAINEASYCFSTTALPCSARPPFSHDSPEALP